MNRGANELAAEANHCMRRLEEALRPEGPEGRSAAECYEVLGQHRLVGQEMNTTLAHVGAWLEQQLLDGRLRVEGDPFCGEPVMALARLLDGLESAHHSWQALARALENAQVATAGMSTTPRLG